MPKYTADVAFLFRTIQGEYTFLFFLLITTE